MVYFPSSVEELLGPEPDARTPGEYIAYHEAGHIFANRLKIWSGNSFVNELIANVYMAAYIFAKRPDLQWVLQGPSGRFKETPRYTSLADLDYVYTGVGAENYVWFQYHLQRIGAFLVSNQKIPTVMEKLRLEFPATAQKQETLERIIGHLDTIRPGIRGMLGGLAGPTTLRSLKPSLCTTSGGAAASKLQSIAVRNSTDRPVTIITPKEGTTAVEARVWTKFQLNAGASIRLPNGTCIVAGDEPGLAILEKQ